MERKTRQHTIDGIAAAVAGSTLEAGRLGRSYALSQSTTGPATIVGSSGKSSLTSLAAMANGLSAHADESDDSHERSMSHPGCSIVPAALAVAESIDASLESLLRSVALGYDVGCRTTIAIGIDNITPWQGVTSSHALVGVFGSTAASSALLRLTPQQVGWTLSYCAQQAAGLGTIFRDHAHVEKAFVFGGMPARNGVVAAELVASGFSGVHNAFAGNPNFFDLFPGTAEPDELIEALGHRFEIAATNLKKYPVGSPNQAIVQAIEDLLRESPPDVDSITSVEIRVPSYILHIVRQSAMPAVCAEFIAALTILDGSCTFKALHDEARMKDRDTQRLMARVSVTGDDTLGRSRAAHVRIESTNAPTREKYVAAARGSVHDPMENDEVRAKARSLMEPVLGADTAAAVLEIVDAGDARTSVRELAHLLSG